MRHCPSSLTCGGAEPDIGLGMASNASAELTLLLQEWSEGGREALDKLVPLVYAELRRLSRHYLNKQPQNPTLQTTDLINEAFVRLIDQKAVGWQSRAHFFGIAARTMRNILVDRARHRGRAKRGGGRRPIPFDEMVTVVRMEKDRDLLALDDALTDLSAMDARLGRLVELRVFGGLSIRETAEVLDVSPATVKRGWHTAKLWLHRETARS